MTQGPSAKTQWPSARLIADLVDRHAARLELYASQWTNGAEDCVQEALVELAGQAHPPEHVVAWLYRVVRNRALNSARSAQRRHLHEGLAARIRDRGAGSDEIATGLSGDESVLPKALAALDALDRETVVLRIWSDLTWQQIAELTNTSSSTAQRRYVAALKQLKRYLESPCPPKTICREN